MHPKSYAKLTPEDDLTIRKWKWRLAAVYGAILLFLVLIVAAGPYTSTNTASSRIEHGFSAATQVHIPREAQGARATDPKVTGVHHGDPARGALR